jgi:hypothetical protein
MTFWQVAIDCHDPDDPSYWVVMHDPEGNGFCIS